jgi:hypothetical protein
LLLLAAKAPAAAVFIYTYDAIIHEIIPDRFGSVSVQIIVGGPKTQRSRV